MSPLSRKLWRDLWHQRMQVLTIALVVASGVGGFIGSLSAHRSLVLLRDSYYETGRFAHVFAQARRVPAPIARRIEQLPDVSAAEFAVTGSATLALTGVSAALTATVLSLPDDSRGHINMVYLRSGHWPAPDDPRGVLVSESFARARALKPGDPLTLLMNGRQHSAQVTGIALSPAYIFAVSRGGFADDSSFAIIWMPRARLEAAYDLRGAFNEVALRVRPGANIPLIVAGLDRLLAPYGATGAYTRAEQTSHRTLTQEIEEQRVFGTVLPAVFLAVAAFLLNVLLGRHVTTERPQIATLKALGYDDRRIGWHYLALALVTVTLGNAAGLMLGVQLGRWMTNLYAEFFRFPSAQYHLEAWIALTAMGLAFLAAVGGAAAAVQRVVALPPAEALRPVAPARYRQSALQRSLLLRRLPPESRMIAREIERRPIRAALTTLGVASSVAIVVAGTWWNDAFNHLVEQELFRRDRAQILLVMNRALDVAARFDLARLPGVLDVELARVVPVRLRHGSRSYRTAVTGLDSNAQLRQVLTPADTPLVAAPGGLILTDRLADTLGVGAGASVEMEILEGLRRTESVRVVAISGDLMGMQAYMERRHLARMVGDGDSFSLARLRFDYNQLDSFLAAVGRTPMIAAAGDKERLVRHFRATSQRNFLYFAAILSTLAAFIALGVVYNSARIALAEHAWELATLRVMGFTRGEVSWLLLGQLALEVALAIPLGCLAGLGLSALIVHLIAAPDFRIPLVVGSGTYAIACLVMIVAGLISALAVRRRIDRLDLIGVLKTRE